MQSNRKIKEKSADDGRQNKKERLKGENMKATLEKMGMDFIDNGNGSDVGNYRVRAEFTDRDGLTVIADFSGFNRWKVLGPTGCRVTHKNALHIDGTYRDEDGTGRDYAYRLRENGFNFEKYSFTLSGILAFLSDVTGKDFTEIEFTN